jgi:hypothetical protein
MDHNFLIFLLTVTFHPSSSPISPPIFLTLPGGSLSFPLSRRLAHGCRTVLPSNLATNPYLLVAPRSAPLTKRQSKDSSNHRAIIVYRSHGSYIGYEEEIILVGLTWDQFKLPTQNSTSHCFSNITQKSPIKNTPYFGKYKKDKFMKKWYTILLSIFFPKICNVFFNETFLHTLLQQISIYIFNAITFGDIKVWDFEIFKILKVKKALVPPNLFSWYFTFTQTLYSVCYRDREQKYYYMQVTETCLFLYRYHSYTIQLLGS